MMREDRKELLRVIVEQATAIQHATDVIEKTGKIMERVEKRLAGV